MNISFAVELVPRLTKRDRAFQFDRIHVPLSLFNQFIFFNNFCYFYTHHINGYKEFSIEVMDLIATIPNS